MANDRWYKRLGWFLLFSCITLLIFFVLDWGFHKFLDAHVDTEFEVSFKEEVYTYKVGEIIAFDIETDAKTYTYDFWIGDIDLEVEFSDVSHCEINLENLDIELEPGTYTVKSAVIGKKGIGRYKEYLIETTLVILPKE
ncbi:MAG: hypothetical protein IJE45_00880 [Bacilli bacterium]|nr:hypothetical protein [Bacilli bacterium]